MVGERGRNWFAMRAGVASKAVGSSVSMDGMENSNIGSLHLEYPNALDQVHD